MATTPTPPFACGITSLDPVTQAQHAARLKKSADDLASGTASIKAAAAKAVRAGQPATPPKKRA